MSKVFLGLGSNKGDRLEYLQKALEKLDADKNIKVINYASIYVTLPYGVEDQPNYYNSVVEVESNYSVENLYKFVKNLEEEIGRKKTFRWGPREIDIDILLVDDLVYQSDNLTIPHRDLLNRDFVLKPLLEIIGEFIHPNTKEIINTKFLSNLENHIIETHNPILLKSIGAAIVRN